jgi:acyl-CoA thioesterase I
MDIGVWGDSIVYGSCDSEGLGWVGRLRKQITPNKDRTAVYNRGICGDTTADLLKRFTVEFESIKPEVVVFGIGINDSGYRKELTNNLVSIEEVKTSLATLINKAKTSAQKVFVVGLTKVTESMVAPLPASSTEKSFSNSLIQTYDKALKEVAEASGTVFIDMFELLADEDLADGLHPNAQGYEKMYKAIFPFVLK